MIKAYTLEMYDAMNPFRHTDRSLSLLKETLIQIKKDIIETGESDRCPLWGCVHCTKMFPKSYFMNCPCWRYTPKHLIRRLTYIIEHFPKEVKDDN